MHTSQKALYVAISLLFSHQAFATNGYFSHGYGVKSQAMGGVGIALPQDSLAAAANPAGLGLVGDRLDIGLTWFRPDRETTITAPSPAAGTYDGNDTDNFFIPEFGYNRQINSDVTLGVSVYGNGGMNTDYKNGIPLLNGGTNDRTGIDYVQLFVAPTVTWKITPNHILGASVILGYQRFEAKGLQSFQAPGFSAYPNRLTDQGHDDALGAGLHVGWIGQLSDAVTLGATYQTKTRFQKFDQYKGLFANEGEMDAPATYGVGIAVKTTPQLTIAADVQRILYSDVDAIGNLSLSNVFSGHPAGASDGAGFGWRDVTAVKLGILYACRTN